MTRKGRDTLSRKPRVRNGSGVRVRRSGPYRSLVALLGTPAPREDYSPVSSRLRAVQVWPVWSWPWRQRIFRTYEAGEYPAHHPFEQGVRVLEGFGAGAVRQRGHDERVPLLGRGTGQVGQVRVLGIGGRLPAA